MNYVESLAFIETLRSKAYNLELGPIAEACRMFGNPQNEYPSAHISGTNGKGSTSAFFSDIMDSNKYKVGLYTSPHLVDVRERIQIGRQMISEKDFAALISEIREKMPDERMLSYFEILTLLAFEYFKRKKVDFAIFEAGLGGRLDATNVITPKVSIITPISFDHIQNLGSTLARIAREKCGIIKRGVPTVVAYQVPEVMEVIKRSCDDVGSPLCLATPDSVTFKLGLIGEHQKQNAACAMEAVELLGQSGFRAEKIEESMSKTNWPGRLEMVATKPRVIVDAAHNVAGAESLASYVRSTVKRDDAILILGILIDKDMAGIVRPLAPLFKEIICVEAPSPRAVSPKDLAAAARSSGANIKIMKNTGEAIMRITKKMGKGDTLFISGSLTVVGEAKSYFNRTGK